MLLVIQWESSYGDLRVSLFAQSQLDLDFFAIDHSTPNRLHIFSDLLKINK